MAVLVTITVAILLYVAYVIFRVWLLEGFIESYKKGKGRSEEKKRLDDKEQNT